jgi:hypothetical protein
MQQDWLRYFEKKGRTDPPWFHNDDESDWFATADDGVKNWKKTIEELLVWQAFFLLAR